MKVYTETGDRGRTSLLSGERVSKNHVRIKAYGAVDELNSIIGATIASLPATLEGAAADMRGIQSVLFQLGAWLAATPHSEALKRLKPLTPDDTHRLESLIDALDAELPELKAFVLPGGHPGGALAHVARAVCRRVERTLVDLSAAQEEQREMAPVMSYINRLSDYLFVIARYINYKADVSEVFWPE